ncbi:MULTISPECIES: BTAD domain-containing putative transcriptional regulator [unclassified Saccharopolyspora]|uniref:AfsR/SARP family transcriptional regulator n=1 Tax=unclassified Saccharopolyspora TaxID=2646250 RepID=UPI001CD3471A|nr:MULTISPECIES: BTAD domain-containing putative transcriptional regulator [unclassified Saccharopolyspora]MCA1189716.1 winged helix-turn-helix domain-containing protein [Saccharopolyspora sp. 6T]MCA1279116.1 winged helix-turn-helix domain-containing protein [Saccharopolyspora sp. 7B]
MSAEREGGRPVPGTGLGFTVLGPLRAWRGTTELDLGPVRQQAFLVSLLLRPDVTTSRQRLLDEVWGDEPPGTGVKVVPGYVYRLRKSLGGTEQDPVISADRGGYRFHGAGVGLDWARLDDLAAAADRARRAGDPETAVRNCCDALALFDGEPLAGLPGPFAAARRREWAERRLALARQRADCLLELGRHAEAVGELSALAVAHPGDEALAVLLMRALHGSGRRADALAVFTVLRERMVADLGVEPGTAAQWVQRAVLLGDDAALAPRRWAVAARPATRDELPADVGPLAGREQELALLTGAADPGAVSVAAVDGVAGSGKTALAVTAARALRAHGPAGCLFVDLHGHREDREALPPERVLRRLLRAVGVDDSAIPDDVDELAASWRAATNRLRLLVVLDDATSAAQVRPLLPAGPGSRVLVTSRRRLAGLDAAHRVSLGPLDDAAARGLLVGGVGEPRDERERAAVAELVRLCGRLPLALRIAGARLQNRPMWTAGDLVARLSDDGARLGELTAGDRSVEAAFRLSYRRIPVPDRAAFRALSRAPAPELDCIAVAAMLDRTPAQALRMLEALVDANLVQQPVAGRYRLHDLVAVFARRLAADETAETTAAAGRLLDLYLSAARCAGEVIPPERAPAPFRGVREAADWLDSAGDLSDVVAYAVATGHVDHACWIAEAVVDQLLPRGRAHECHDAVRIALDRLPEATDQRMVAALRSSLGAVEIARCRYPQALTLFEDAAATARRRGERGEEARAKTGIGMATAMSGARAEGLAALDEAIRLATELGDDRTVERAGSVIGYLRHLDGEHEAALRWFADLHALGEKLGSTGMMGRALCHTGSVRLVVGEVDAAAEALRAAADLAERSADPALLTTSLTRLGSAEQARGDLTAALAAQRRALELFPARGHASMEVELRDRLGRTCLLAGLRDEAREHFEAAVALAELAGRPDELAAAREALRSC